MAKTAAPKASTTGKKRPPRVPARPAAGPRRASQRINGGSSATTTFPLATGAFTVEQPPDAGAKRERFSFAKIPHVLEISNLIELQKASFNWFKTDGLADAFASISPIKDFTGNLILEFGEHSLG